ncbi:MAG: hypothetical protein MI808_23900 [Pseudomonadales bacterium]|nr:hypothetical protein [Pseudomonadales bacterium]
MSANVASDETPDESLFVALKALRGLHSMEGERQVLLADVVSYVEGGDDRLDKVKNAVVTDLSVRRQLQWVLQQRRLAAAPAEALAQDSAELEMRIGAGFRLLFRQSRADKEHVYVVLEMDSTLQTSEGAKLLLIAQSDTLLTRVPFAEVSGGRSQIILRKDDDQLKAIQNPNATLSLLEL